MRSELVALGKVLASGHRLRVVNLLSRGMMTPGQISKALNTTMPYASKIIRQLVALGLVECSTPELRKGKLYRLTNLGVKTMQDLRTIAFGSRSEESVRDV